MVGISVSLKAKDVVFKFKDSCNCCYKSQQEISPTTTVFVDQRGRVVPFIFRSQDRDKDSLRRCITNVDNRLRIVSERLALDHQDLKHTLRERADLDLSAEDFITADQITRVNALATSMLRSSNPKIDN